MKVSDKNWTELISQNSSMSRDCDSMRARLALCFQETRDQERTRRFLWCGVLFLLLWSLIGGMFFRA